MTVRPPLLRAQGELPYVSQLQHGGQRAQLSEDVVRKLEPDKRVLQDLHARLGRALSTGHATPEHQPGTTLYRLHWNRGDPSFERLTPPVTEHVVGKLQDRLDRAAPLRGLHAQFDDGFTILHGLDRISGAGARVQWRRDNRSNDNGVCAVEN